MMVEYGYGKPRDRASVMLGKWQIEGKAVVQ